MVDDPNDDAREKAAALLVRIADDAEVRKQCDALGLAGVARDRVRVIAQEVGAGSRTKEEAQEAMGVLVGLLLKVEPKTNWADMWAKMKRVIIANWLCIYVFIYLQMIKLNELQHY